MRVLTSDSLSSTEMNTTSKDENFPPLRVSGCSSDETNLSKQSTPHVANVDQDSTAADPAAPEETMERLRVSVLYLEGITSPNIPATRISAWVGFRSSFPPDAMSISSSNYSSFFLKEGNLLAVESDQVKWTPTDDENDCKPSYSGIAFWDSVTAKETTKSHLEIEIQPQSLPQSNDGEQDSNPLPDILEFHICIVQETAAAANEAKEISSVLSKNKSSASMQKWDNEMEEVHWYNDEEEGQCDEATHTSLEQQLHHGVAHLKVHYDPDNNEFDSDGKIVHLPIRMIPPRSNPSNDHTISLGHAATLTIQAEKVHVPKYLPTTEQRHYIKNTWNGGQQCAPLSVKCNDEKSSKDEEGNQKGESLAKHFRFDTIKSIISCRKPPEVTDQSTQKVIIEDPQPSKESMNKIQEALESSFKSMNDSKKLAAAMREQRQFEHISPNCKPIPLPQDISSRKQPKELALDDCLTGLPATANNLADNSSANDINNLATMLATTPLKSNARVQPLKAESQQQLDQASLPRKSIMSRLLCGADLTEVMHHCDEDHVGMYVVDSRSLSSTNT